MHKIHAIFTGFPLAILLVVIIFELLSRFKLKLFNEYNNIYRFLLLIIFLFFTVITFLTGYFADWYLPEFSEQALLTFDNHYFYAKLILFISIFPIFLRFLMQTSNKKLKSKSLDLIYIISLFLCLTLIIVIGYFGGELIFTHGIGVEKQF